MLRQAGVTDGQIFVAEHQGGGELAALVAQAWDLPAIEQRYEEFLAEFASASAADPLIRLTELVHAWRRFPAIDPGLPGPAAASPMERRPGRETVRGPARQVVTRCGAAVDKAQRGRQLSGVRGGRPDRQAGLRSSDD